MNFPMLKRVPSWLLYVALAAGMIYSALALTATPARATHVCGCSALYFEARNECDNYHGGTTSFNCNDYSGPTVTYNYTCADGTYRSGYCYK